MSPTQYTHCQGINRTHHLPHTACFVYILCATDKRAHAQCLPNCTIWRCAPPPTAAAQHMRFSVKINTFQPAAEAAAENSAEIVK